MRDVIEPWDLPITKGLQESTHAFQRLEEEIESAHSGVADGQAAALLRDPGRGDRGQATAAVRRHQRLALARTFKLIDAELKAVHSEEWEGTFNLLRLLI